MRQIHFVGIVHPERAAVTISEITQDLSLADGVNLGRLTLKISASQLNAILETALHDVDIVTLRNSLLPRIESLVDNLGFNLGCGYQVEIVQAINAHTGDVTVFGVGLEFLQGRFDLEELQIRFKKIAFLCKEIEGVYFQRTLALLRNAIRSPFETGLYCFMAIESLRNIYCLQSDLDPEKDKAKSWNLLRNDLSVTKEFIEQNIKAYADVIRHGGIRPFTELERITVLKSTWELIEKYINKHGAISA